MPRCGVHVRLASVDDVPALVLLAAELRDFVGSRGTRLGRSHDPADLAARYAEALADSSQRLVVAVDEQDAVVGMALLSLAQRTALSDIAAVRMSHCVVADRHRRRGAGKALVAAAAAYAEEHSCDHVLVDVRPGAREVNRFFARLGFASLVVRRVAPVTTIRRRLAGADVRPLAELTRRRPLRRMARFAEESADDVVDDPMAPTG